MANIFLNEFVERLREENNPNAVDRLLDMILKLDYFYILLQPAEERNHSEGEETKNQPNPFFAELDDLVWMFAYSDIETLIESATTLLPNTPPEQVRYLQMPLDTGITWLAQHKEVGVYGLYFNEGPHSFYFGLEELGGNNEGA